MYWSEPLVLVSTRQVKKVSRLSFGSAALPPWQLYNCHSAWLPESFLCGEGVAATPTSLMITALKVVTLTLSPVPCPLCAFQPGSPPSGSAPQYAAMHDAHAHGALLHHQHAQQFFLGRGGSCWEAVVEDEAAAASPAQRFEAALPLLLQPAHRSRSLPIDRDSSLHDTHTMPPCCALKRRTRSSAGGRRQGRRGVVAGLRTRTAPIPSLPHHTLHTSHTTLLLGLSPVTSTT